MIEVICDLPAKTDFGERGKEYDGVGQEGPSKSDLLGGLFFNQKVRFYSPTAAGYIEGTVDGLRRKDRDGNRWEITGIVTKHWYDPPPCNNAWRVGKRFYGFYVYDRRMGWIQYVDGQWPYQ